MNALTHFSLLRSVAGSAVALEGGTLASSGERYRRTPSLVEAVLLSLSLSTCASSTVFCVYTNKIIINLM